MTKQKYKNPQKMNFVIEEKYGEEKYFKHQVEEEKTREEAIGVFNKKIFNNWSVNEEKKKIIESITDALFKTFNNGEHKDFKTIIQNTEDLINKDEKESIIYANLFLMSKKAKIKDFTPLKACAEILFPEQVEYGRILFKNLHKASIARCKSFLNLNGDDEESEAASIVQPQYYNENQKDDICNPPLNQEIEEDNVLITGTNKFDYSFPQDR